jgi:hypothetical protein
MPTSDEINTLRGFLIGPNSSNNNTNSYRQILQNDIDANNRQIQRIENSPPISDINQQRIIDFQNSNRLFQAKIEQVNNFVNSNVPR